MNSAHRKSYKKYKILEKLLKFRYKGYQFDSIIAKDISFYAYRRLDISNLSYSSIKKRFGLFFSLEYVQDFFQKDIILFSSVSNRANYIQLIDNVRRKLNTPSLLVLHENNIKQCFPGSNVIKALAYFPFFLIITASVRVSLYLCSMVCYHLNTIKQAEKIYKDKKIAIRKLITLDCTYGEDSLLTAFFKKRKITTASLQHSIIYEFRNFKPEEITKYKITEPDLYLCWSEGQKRLLEEKFGIDPSILIVAGNPTYNHKLEKHVKQSFSYGLVLLSRFYYHDENIELLNLLLEVKKKTGIQFDVRPHPSLKEHIEVKKKYYQYTDICKDGGFELKDDFSITLDKIMLETKYDFTISYNTAAYFDSLMNGLLSFRYALNLNEDLDTLDDKFLTNEDLIKQIKKYSTIDNTLLSKQISDIATYIGGLGIDNYSAILD